MWALWVAGGLLVWLLVAVAVAVVIGRGIRLADRREALTANVVVDPADFPIVAPSAAGRAAPRRRIPLPPIGIALVATTLALETSGYLTRLTGVTGSTRHLLSMDAPLSLPRMFIALLFAAAAAAALVVGGNIPGRRTWWTAVGVIGGLIAAVKAGGTLHVALMHTLAGAVGRAGAQAISVVLALAVLTALWVLSRDERRDRRRILGTLALYAGAAVGLSALSGLLADAHGASSAAAAAATYVEESGEGLSGVAFLIAVLAGVAPRLVLPAEWVLRREADAHTLDVPEQLPGRALPR